MYVEMVVGPFDVERYKRWRATIPYTDEQIIEALKEAIKGQAQFFQKVYQGKTERNFERLKEGKVSQAIIRFVLPYLIKKCNICGKTALYRYGMYGRCREHKFVVPKDYAAYVAAMDLKATTTHKEVEEKLNRTEKARLHARILKPKQKA